MPEIRTDYGIMLAIILLAALMGIILFTGVIGQKDKNRTIKPSTINKLIIKKNSFSKDTMYFRDKNGDTICIMTDVVIEGNAESWINSIKKQTKTDENK